MGEGTSFTFMKQFRFLDWNIYTLAQDLFIEISALVRTIPREYRFDLGSQLNRAAFSVILNIAEGSGKKTDADLKRFLDIALGSLYEVRAAVDTLCKINILDALQQKGIREKTETLARQIGGFKRSLD
ncbi:MAG: four helix bundle protein [Patescibacteria group bacterium]